MKKFFLLSTGFIFSLMMIAQGNSNDNGKEKDKSKNEKSAKQGSSEQKEKVANEKKQQEEHNKKIWAGTSDKNGKGPIPSKNQPAKVRAAFQRDYPNASNVTWSKYRGDWTATFSNGGITSTAVYHANGQRKDTRTAIGRSQLPQVIEDIFNKKQGVQVGNITRIDLPGAAQQLFRIKTIQGNSANYVYYDKHGKQVNYD